jgi:ABC-type sugar transport system ATPase subunit
MENEINTPVLQMIDICKSYPGVQALLNANYEVSKGEIHGLVGKNGAGKSTLVQIMMGLQELDSGAVKIEGIEHRKLISSEARAAGISYVPQQVRLMDSLSVAENVLAGNLPKTKAGFIKWGEAYKDAEERLIKLGLNLDVRKPVEGLTVAELTMLAIAKALFSNAKIIILDESTAPLPRADICQLFEFVKSLRDQGVSFIYISHHLEEVFEICDRVTVMKDGITIGTYPVSELNMQKLTKLIVGEDVHEFTRVSTCNQEKEILNISGLTKRGSYEDVNLTIHQGEIVGLSGLQGCGAEQLAAGLFGLNNRGIGTVQVNGKEFTAREPKEAYDQGLAFLPQNRHKFGIVGIRSIRENISYTSLDKLVNKLGIINVGKEKELTSEYIESLGIKTPGMDQLVRQLSGGNQQKVVFAKLAATKPAVLVLHEPTIGIDVRAKQDIFRIINDLACDGHAILIISSEVRELLGICDKIYVMYRGLITKKFVRGEKDSTAHNLLQAIEGGVC